MTALKSGIIAIGLVAGLAGSVQAQFVTGGFRSGGYSSYPGYGASNGYYTANSGFGNYGLPGAYPSYRGYGLPGYGPGAPIGGYYSPIRPNLAPQTTNNMGGLINAIRTQTGRGNSYGYGMNRGFDRRRGR